MTGSKAGSFEDQTANIKGSPRQEFIYVNDDGAVVAIRLDQWKAVFLENRADAFQIWREPFTELRVPQPTGLLHLLDGEDNVLVRLSKLEAQP